MTKFDGFEPQVRDRLRRLEAERPAARSALPEEALLGRETLDVVKRAIEAVPVAQRSVIAMRGIAGLDADEVCDALGLSAGNQRVLLHRARSRVRAALKVHLDG